MNKVQQSPDRTHALSVSGDWPDGEPESVREAYEKLLKQQGGKK